MFIYSDIYPLAGIYRIANRLTGESYVGQALDAPARLDAHLSALRRRKSHNAALQASFIRYGEAVFSFQFVEFAPRGLSHFDYANWMNASEAHYISVFNASFNLISPPRQLGEYFRRVYDGDDEEGQNGEKEAANFGRCPPRCQREKARSPGANSGSTQDADRSRQG